MSDRHFFALMIWLMFIYVGFMIQFTRVIDRLDTLIKIVDTLKEKP